jgi:hypothetical protein
MARRYRIPGKGGRISRMHDGRRREDMLDLIEAARVLRSHAVRGRSSPELRAFNVGFRSPEAALCQPAEPLRCRDLPRC